jgi:hypothetical protein
VVVVVVVVVVAVVIVLKVFNLTVMILMMRFLRLVDETFRGWTSSESTKTYPCAIRQSKQEQSKQERLSLLRWQLRPQSFFGRSIWIPFRI